jgi:hypothetical protein
LSAVEGPRLSFTNDLQKKKREKRKKNTKINNNLNEKLVLSKPQVGSNLSNSVVVDGGDERSVQFGQLTAILHDLSHSWSFYEAVLDRKSSQMRQMRANFKKSVVFDVRVPQVQRNESFAVSDN